MSVSGDGLRGTVHGSIIVLENEAGLPDGQVLQVSIRPVQHSEGEGFLRSAGAWADDPEGVDEFLKATRRARNGNQLTTDTRLSPG